MRATRPLSPPADRTVPDRLTLACVHNIGLTKFDFGPPLPATAHRTQGYNLGLVAILESSEDLKGYAEHPAHIKVNDLRLAVTDETLAYDMEF